MIEAKALK